MKENKKCSICGSSNKVCNTEIGLLCGKQLCNIAPDLSKVTDKSGLNVDFKQTDGYKYAKNAIDRETDIFDPDVFRNIKESEQKETAPVKA